jgi:hypothetical protein
LEMQGFILGDDNALGLSFSEIWQWTVPLTDRWGHNGLSRNEWQWKKLLLLRPTQLLVIVYSMNLIDTYHCPPVLKPLIIVQSWTCPFYFCDPSRPTSRTRLPISPFCKMTTDICILWKENDLTYWYNISLNYLFWWCSFKIK